MAEIKHPARSWQIDYDVALEVASHEAIVRQTYRDSKNIPTWSIGLTNASGHDVTRYVGKPQPMAFCLRIYVWALERYAEDVRKAFGETLLTKPQFAAALSFHYNTGAIGRAAWVKSFRLGKVEQAKREIMQWVTPPEIRERREEERDLFFDGKWSNDGRITEYTKVNKNGTPVWKSGKRVNIEAALREALGSTTTEAATAPIEKPVTPPKTAIVLTPDIIRLQQAKLRDLGYYEVGLVDGSIGEKTRNAAAAFQEIEGLEVTRELDAATIARLQTAGPRPVSPERANRTLDDLRRGNAQVVIQNDKVKETAAATASAGGLSVFVTLILTFFGDAWAATAIVREAFSVVPGWVWALTIGGAALLSGVYAWRRANSAQLWRLDDERTGRHNGVTIEPFSTVSQQRTTTGDVEWQSSSPSSATPSLPPPPPSP